MPNDKTEAIQIDHALYIRLRAFCDRENIRFSNFLRDSLENALNSENFVKPLENEIEKLQKKAVKYDYAFNRGFQQGFSFLYLILNGLNVSRASEEELKILRKFPAEAPKGEQIGLF